MISLKEPLAKSVEFQGKRYKVNLSFNRVLQCTAIMRCDDLWDVDKTDACLYLLCGRNAVRRLKTAERVPLLETIFNTMIFPEKPKSDGKQVYDFEQDAEYIYSSFMVDYGIDLLEMQDKLDWRKFMALFGGLSEHTKMREVINIRTREIPKPNKNNAQERAAIIKAKQFYALKSTNNYQDGLMMIFNVLKSMAKE